MNENVFCLFTRPSVFFYKKLPPYIPAGFDLTTHSSSLLDSVAGGDHTARARLASVSFCRSCITNSRAWWRLSKVSCTLSTLLLSTARANSSGSCKVVMCDLSTFFDYFQLVSIIMTHFQASRIDLAKWFSLLWVGFSWSVFLFSAGCWNMDQTFITEIILVRSIEVWVQFFKTCLGANFAPRREQSQI
jgi:hypothetical protein